MVPADCLDNASLSSDGACDEEGVDQLVGFEQATGNHSVDHLGDRVDEIGQAFFQELRLGSGINGLVE